MRILIIQGGFGTGGAEKVIAQIANHRAALGDDVHIAGMVMPPRGPYFTLHPAVTTHAHHIGAGGSSRLGQFDRLRWIRHQVKQIKPDLILSFLTKINVLTLIATFGLAVPVMISERNNPFLQNLPIWRHAQRALSRRAAGVVLTSPRAKLRLDLRARHEIRVIPNPCSPIAIPDGPYLKHKDLHFGAVGRLEWQKGYDMLIDSFGRLHDRHPGARLTIWGEGSYRQKLEEQRDRLGLQDVIALPGNTRSAGEWASQVDVVVMSSRFEGFSNVIAEATVTGLPIISFNCEFGPSDMIRHEENGLLVALGDLDGLADAMARMITEPALLTRFQAAYGQNRAWLDPQNILDTWDDLIASIMNSASRGKVGSEPRQDRQAL